MKILIRRGMFETNSSSVQALIITNKREKDKDYAAMKKEEYIWYPEYIQESQCVHTKEDKVLMLGGLFDSENVVGGWMKEEYKIFMKVLKDNNETELIEKVRANSKEFKDYPDEPYCTNYFWEGCLIECSCSFYSKFNAYFKHGSLTLKDLRTDLEDFDLDEEHEKILKQIVRKNRKELYDKIKDFIYGDGLIIPYATM